MISVLVFVWAILSGWLARHNVTGPLLFVVLGYVLANPHWGPLAIDVETGSIHLVAEITLALVLFSDAARVNLHELRRDLALPARLLGVGLLLSVLAGALLAAGLLLDLPWALAAFLGAALAPTDAALSAQVINDERIPTRLRRALNVESGLNDGIVTPVVTVVLAVAATQLGVISASSSSEAGGALRELAAGLAIGLIAGMAGATLINFAARHQRITTGSRRVAALAVPVSAFAVALAGGANGFIAAFVAGMAFGASLDTDMSSVEQTDELPDLGGQVLALVVWFLFGATLVPIAFGHLDTRTIAYALLSLTVVRMAPVAVSLLRSGLDRPTVVFIAWFGPRGLASVVFALLAIEELGTSSSLVVDHAVGAVALTVLLSVILHGLTARPGGRRYVQREAAEAEAALTAKPRPSIGDRTQLPRQ